MPRRPGPEPTGCRPLTRPTIEPVTRTGPTRRAAGPPAAATTPRPRRRSSSAAGPSGSACAYWLADAGWDVVVVEKKHFPREKTCGDGLTPRAVRQLADMGLEDALAGAHRYDGPAGLRPSARCLEMAWPEHPAFPAYGYIITRHDLDALVAERAAKAGATVWQGTEAVGPCSNRVRGRPAHRRTAAWPSCPGARWPRDRARRRAGPAGGPGPLRGGGRRRQLALRPGPRHGPPDRTTRMGMALRGYYRSPRHDDPFIESHLDIRDADGDVVPGYGWIFPLGDGRVNVGVGLLSTDRRWKGVNTTQLMDAFVE